jgi:general secretion pathway protein D
MGSAAAALPPGQAQKHCWTIPVLCGRMLPCWLMLLMLTSCDYYHRRLDPSVFDADRNLSREAYRQGLITPSAPAASTTDSAEPPIPTLHPVTLLPPIDALPDRKRVSLQVTDTVPLKDVLFELGRKANINFKIDANIKGGINFSAVDQPFTTLLDNLCRAAALRCHSENGFLVVEKDTPYYLHYPVSFLNLMRKGSNQISISTDVFSNGMNSQPPSGQNGDAAGAASASGTSENGSSSVLESSSDSDFWTVVEINIAMMLNDTAPNIVSADQDPAPPAGEENPAAARVGMTTAVRDGPRSRLTSNRQAGVISVFATQQEHARIASFLRDVERKVNAQVVIEAKIIEVALNDRYSAGINWQTLLRDKGTFSARARLSDPVRNNPITTVSDSVLDSMAIGVSAENLSAVLELIESFGSTRTLSSPRVTVLNNQPAIVKVAENQVYFQVNFEREESVVTNQGDRVNVSSRVMTIPVGLVMMVQPSVDLAKNTITMTVRPTISRIQGFVSDPAVAIASQNTVSSTIPVVEVREIDSIVGMKSGEVILMGGLMQERANIEDAGVPGAKDLPILGTAFKRKRDDKRLIELVILLKAQIVASPQPDAQDKALYERYVNDPRPFAF